MHNSPSSLWFAGLLLLAFSFFTVSCTTLSKTALNVVGDALTAEGSNTVFTGDSDAKLVGDALPFAIKMYESLASANPRHAGLKRQVGMMYVMYANAFVAGPADYLAIERFEEKLAARKRAASLYLRGRDFVLQGLDLTYPGFQTAWNKNEPATVMAYFPKLKPADIGSFYWLAAGHLSAFALQPTNLVLGNSVARTVALVERAYELNPNYQKAVLDELLLSIHASIPPEMGGKPEKKQEFYDRAQAKTPGGSTGAWLTWATAVDLPTQNREHFVEMMNKVLAVDAKADPNATLATLLNQERARWYLTQLDDLFI